MDKLSTLRMRALALRSSIHNEQQLSAIELTAMCAKKTNELIDVINDLTDFVQGLALSVGYDEATESLTITGGSNNG